MNIKKKPAEMQVFCYIYVGFNQKPAKMQEFPPKIPLAGDLAFKSLHFCIYFLISERFRHKRCIYAGFYFRINGDP